MEARLASTVLHRGGSGCGRYKVREVDPLSIGDADMVVSTQVNGLGGDRVYESFYGAEYTRISIVCAHNDLMTRSDTNVPD